jgi:hypothetical protein
MVLTSFLTFSYNRAGGIAEAESGVQRDLLVRKRMFEKTYLCVFYCNRFLIFYFTDSVIVMQAARLFFDLLRQSAIMLKIVCYR